MRKEWMGGYTYVMRKRAYTCVFCAWKMCVSSKKGEKGEKKE